jgi:hypothetical protein
MKNISNLNKEELAKEFLDVRNRILTQGQAVEDCFQQGLAVFISEFERRNLSIPSMEDETT